MPPHLLYLTRYICIPSCSSMYMRNHEIPLKPLRSPFTSGRRTIPFRRPHSGQAAPCMTLSSPHTHPRPIHPARIAAVLYTHPRSSTSPFHPFSRLLLLKSAADSSHMATAQFAPCDAPSSTPAAPPPYNTKIRPVVFLYPTALLSPHRLFTSHPFCGPLWPDTPSTCQGTSLSRAPL